MTMMLRPLVRPRVVDLNGHSAVSVSSRFTPHMTRRTRRVMRSISTPSTNLNSAFFIDQVHRRDEVEQDGEVAYHARMSLTPSPLFSTSSRFCFW